MFLIIREANIDSANIFVLWTHSEIYFKHKWQFITCVLTHDALHIPVMCLWELVNQQFPRAHVYMSKTNYVCVCACSQYMCLGVHICVPVFRCVRVHCACACVCICECVHMPVCRVRVWVCISARACVYACRAVCVSRGVTGACVMPLISSDRRNCA